MNNERGKNNYALSLFCIILCFSFIHHSLETWKKSTQSWDQESHEESGRWSHYLLPFPFEKSDVVLVSFLSRIWRRKHLHFIWQEHSKLSHKLSFKLLLKIILLRQQRKSHINSIYSNYLDKWCRECRRKIPWPGFYVEETFYINKCGRCCAILHPLAWCGPTNTASDNATTPSWKCFSPGVNIHSAICLEQGRLYAFQLSFCKFYISICSRPRAPTICCHPPPPIILSRAATHLLIAWYFWLREKQKINISW